MPNRSNRIWTLALALIAMWVIVFWLTPARRAGGVGEAGEVRVSFTPGPDDDRGAEGAGIGDSEDGSDPGSTGPLPRVQGSEDAEQSEAPNHQPVTPEVPPQQDPPKPPDPQTQPPPTPPSPPTPEGGTIPPSYTEYTVQRGDTLSKISIARWGTADYAEAIARMNGSSVDPLRLKIGQVIKIPVDPKNVQGIPADPDDQPAGPSPGFKEYTVARGDTLGEIAKAFYGNPNLWTRIRDANPKINRDGTNIREGWKLMIPPPP